MSGERNWGKTKTRQKDGAKELGRDKTLSMRMTGKEKRARETKG